MNRILVSILSQLIVKGAGAYAGIPLLLKEKIILLAGLKQIPNVLGAATSWDVCRGMNWEGLLMFAEATAGCQTHFTMSQ